MFQIPTEPWLLRAKRDDDAVLHLDPEPEDEEETPSTEVVLLVSEAPCPVSECQDSRSADGEQS